MGRTEGEKCFSAIVLRGSPDGPGIVTGAACVSKYFLNESVWFVEFV